MTTPSISPDLLDRYLAGETTTDETARVAAWLAATPHAPTIVAGLRGGTYAGTVTADERSHVLRLLEGKIGQELSDAARPGTPVRRIVPTPRASGLRRAVVAIAAAAAVVVAGAQGWRWFAGTVTPRQLASYATENGQRTTVTLPDGSVATLNAATRLDLSPDFGHGDRTVTVHGEVYFTVAHHEGMPFTVVAGVTRARVLGTNFVVRRYANEARTLVAVRDGKVAVRSVVLTAGRQATVDDHDAIVVRDAAPSRFAFVSGTLTLDRQPLPNAIPELNRWYDVDIRLGDPSLARAGVFGDFVAGSADDLAAMLEYTLRARVVRDGRRLTLYPR